MPVFWPPDVKSQLLRKHPNVGKHWEQEEKGTTEDEIVGWHYRLNAHEFEQALEADEEQGSLPCCSARGHKELNLTESLNNSHNNWCTRFFLSKISNLLGNDLDITWVICKPMFNFIRNRQTIFQQSFLLEKKAVYCFACPLAIKESFCCYSFWPAFISHFFFFFLPFNINHWNRCELVFHCGFSLHFPSEKLYRTSLHVFICQPYILFDELSVQTLCVCVLISQLCPTLCNPMNSLVHLSMESSRQEYWSGLQFPSSGIICIHGMTGLLHLQADSLPPEPPGKPFYPFLTGCIVF